MAICSILRYLVSFEAIWYMYVMVIWYLFTVLVCCTKKNLATLAPSRRNALPALRRATVSLKCQESHLRAFNAAENWRTFNLCEQ
jgi:hypothetical protein